MPVYSGLKIWPLWKKVCQQVRSQTPCRCDKVSSVCLGLNMQACENLTQAFLSEITLFISYRTGKSDYLGKGEKKNKKGKECGCSSYILGRWRYMHAPNRLFSFQCHKCIGSDVGFCVYCFSAVYFIHIQVLSEIRGFYQIALSGIYVLCLILIAVFFT